MKQSRARTGSEGRLGGTPVRHGCVPVPHHCPGRRVQARGSGRDAASLRGWSLLSGGGSINPWESLDQWKKEKWEFSSPCSNPEPDVASWLGLGPGFLVYELRAFVNSFKVCNCKAGAQFVVCVHVCVYACFLCLELSSFCLHTSYWCKYQLWRWCGGQALQHLGFIYFFLFLIHLYCLTLEQVYSYIITKMP